MVEQGVLPAPERVVRDRDGDRHNFALYLMHEDKEKTLTSYGKNVITHV
ncbi:hypothetical protein ACSNN7_06445 [Micromonospora sp. URMC 105]